MNQPDLIFGPLVPDWHPDHVAAVQLAAGARFEAKLHKTDMPGDPHWTTKVYGYYSTHRLEHEKPSFIVDVTGYWDKKVNAIKAYHSQNENIDAGKRISLLEKVEISCRYFGQCIGSMYGEAFVSYEPMGINKIEFLTGL